MATTQVRAGEGGGSAAAPWIAVLVGTVLVAAMAAAFYVFVFVGGAETQTKTVNVDINAPKLPDINMPQAPKLPQG